jgi:hypothetical protein
MGLWNIDAFNATISPGQTVRRRFHFDGQFNGQQTSHIPVGPVVAVPAPDLFTSSPVTATSQGFQWFDGGSLQNLGCYYVVDIACDGPEQGNYALWVQSWS